MPKESERIMSEHWKDITLEQEREFNLLFNKFISGDGMYLPDKATYMYFYKKGLQSKFK